MTKATGAAFPQHVFTPYHGGGGKWTNEGGLTKREHFASLALQGLLACTNVYTIPGWAAETAVKCADALIAELAKTEGGAA